MRCFCSRAHMSSVSERLGRVWWCDAFMTWARDASARKGVKGGNTTEQWVRGRRRRRGWSTAAGRAVAQDVVRLPDPWIRKVAFRYLYCRRSKCLEWLAGGVVQSSPTSRFWICRSRESVEAVEKRFNQGARSASGHGVSYAADKKVAAGDQREDSPQASA